MEIKVLFIVFMAIFTITAIITLLGITGVLKNIKEKYLTPLFSALILEVVAAVILLFKQQDFSGEKVIPDAFYEASSIEKSASTDVDILHFTELIKKGEQYSHLESTIDSLQNLITSLKTQGSDSTDFYTYIQKIEKIRNNSNGTINLKTQSENSITLTCLEEILYTNGRLDKKKNTKETIVAAFEKFKSDNNRSNASYKIYLQDVPLFVKEYLEEEYELEFTVINPNIPASVLATINEN